MPPTRDHDTPDDQPQQHDPIDPPTVPIRLPHLPHGARLRDLRLVLRHPRPTRPASVWPCAEDELREGTGLIAQWLLTAIIKLVTGYTAPGQRVLLLDPAPHITPPAGWPSTVAGHRPGHGPYAGLLEAGWTVVRLGRGVDTQTAAAHPDRFDDSPTNPPTESESGPGPHAASPASDHLDAGGTDDQSGPNSTTTAHGPDRFELIITAAEPHTLDALQPTDWAGLLTPTGTLAVITHSDNSGAWFTDPAGPLVRAAHHAGLHFTDRIALLRVPIRDTVHAVAGTAPHDHAASPPGPPTTSIRHTRAHDDLFVFTRHPDANGDANAAENREDTSHD